MQRMRKIVKRLKIDHDSMLRHLMTLRTDVDPNLSAYASVRPANYKEIVPMPFDKIAFLHASKRYLIPFEWYSNPRPSTTSTSWAVMLHTTISIP
jgi:hypothetical protein